MMKPWAKVGALLVTAVFLGVTQTLWVHILFPPQFGGWGLSQLRQEFNPVWFIPQVGGCPRLTGDCSPGLLPRWLVPDKLPPLPTRGRARQDQHRSNRLHNRADQDRESGGQAPAGDFDPQRGGQLVHRLQTVRAR